EARVSAGLPTNSSEVIAARPGFARKRDMGRGKGPRKMPTVDPPTPEKTAAVDDGTWSNQTPLHAFYGASVSEFWAQAPERVVGILATRASLEFRGGEREQTRAWQSQVPLLRAALAKVPGSGVWGLVLEYSLRRLGLRPDAVLLAPGVIIALEFKMGSVERRPQDSRQAENYALCIRDFHASARGFGVVPIVCAENAPSVRLRLP